MGRRDIGSAAAAAVEPLERRVMLSVNQPQDPGFETPVVGSGTESSYEYDPAGSPWTFTGGSGGTGSAGISGNGSGFTALNAPAPQGNQVGLLQMTGGTISQSVNFDQGGTYAVTFYAAQRIQWQTGNGGRQDFAVLVDGNVVGTVNPLADGNYAPFSSDAFSVSAGSHTVEFEGLDTAGGDNTAFIDGVAIVQAPPSAIVQDGGFESDAVDATSGYTYEPGGGPWTFTGNAGISGAGVSGNGTAFTWGNPNAPEGQQVAFLQDIGTMTQSVSVPYGGNYLLGLDAAQRTAWANSEQDFNVLVDGSVIGHFEPTASGRYDQYATDPVSLNTGTHTIEFQGLDTAGGDNTAFLDDVRLVQTAGATTTTIAGPPAGLAATGTTPTSVSLQWDPVDGASQYNVYRDGTLVGQSTDPNFTDTTTAGDSDYSYQVTAVTTAGESDPSDAVGVQTVADPALGNNLLWSDAEQPQASFQEATVSIPTGDTLELGVNFTADVSGYVTGVQFYKTADNTGTHVGQLWDADGNLLATATFNDESASAWQQVDFSSPVLLAAGQTYTVSEDQTASAYAFSDSYFVAGGADAAPLHAPAGTNGVYDFVAQPAAPASTYDSSNYWVQPVFVTAVDMSPVAPSDLSAAAASSFEIDLAWTNPDDASTSFLIERSSDGGNTFNAIDQTDPGATSYQDTSVSDSQSYQYELVAVSPTGATSGTSNVASAATPQAIFDGLTAVGVSPSEIDLSWTDHSGGTAGAQVWHSTDDATWTLAGNVPAGTTTFQDTGLTSDTIYYYYVSAPGSPSATGSSNQAVGITLPTAPTGLTATTAFGSGDVNLSWSDAAGDNDGYEILESPDGGSDFTVIADVDAGTTTYDDWSAADGVTDYYEVEAFNLGGDSAPTAVAFATPIGAIVRIDADQAPSAYSYTLGQSPSEPHPTFSGQPFRIDEHYEFFGDENDLTATLSDPNNNANVTVASFTQPAHGSLVDNGNGTLTYQGAFGYIGPDQFTFECTDQYGAPSPSFTFYISNEPNYPRAQSQVVYLLYSYDPGTGAYTPLPVSGRLSGGEASQGVVPIVYHVVSGPDPSQGSFTLDPNTGEFTYTPSTGSSGGPVTVVWDVTANGEVSNLATMVVSGVHDGWRPNWPSMVMIGGGADIPENGEYESYSPAGIAEAQYNYIRTQSYFPDSITVGQVIEAPQHGTLSNLDSATGTFDYTAAPGFVGTDHVTFSLLAGGALLGYTTAFFITMGAPRIAIGEPTALPPGDPNAQIPSAEFPTSDGQTPYAYVYLNTGYTAFVSGDTLPPGSTVTLSVNSDAQSDVDIYQGAPGSPGSQLLLGKDAGTDSHTWTAADWYPVAVLGYVYAVGLSGTTYDGLTFTLTVASGPVIDGTPPSNTPAAAATGQPASATQPATVPGKGGFLEAFDGTWDGGERTNTIIYQFYSKDFALDQNRDNAKYHEGPGANQKELAGKTGDAFDQAVYKLEADLAGGFANDPAKRLVNTGLQEVQTFYSNPANAGTPLNIVGYSRGAFEGVELADLVAKGIPDVATKVTQNGKVTYTAMLHVPLNFVGLISPVAMMHPVAQTATHDPADPNWPATLAKGWAYFYQALDGSPNAWPYLQTPITPDPDTQNLTKKPWPDNHHTIGVDGKVLDELLAAAKTAKLPLK